MKTYYEVIGEYSPKTTPNRQFWEWARHYNYLSEEAALFKAELWVDGQAHLNYLERKGVLVKVELEIA